MEGFPESLQGVAQLLGVEPDDLVGGLDLCRASRLLGLSASALRLRAMRGLIGYQRDGRAWRFYWWHLAQYVANREHAAMEHPSP